MKNKVIKHGSQTYEVKRKRIKSIYFRVFERYTIISIHYIGTRYEELAFNIQNKNKKMDIKLFDELHTSITELNKELLEERQCSWKQARPNYLK